MTEALPGIMFLVLTILLLIGFPVAFTLMGTALLFGLIGFGWGFFNPFTPSYLGGHDQLHPPGGPAVHFHGSDARAFEARRGPPGNDGSAVRKDAGRARHIRGDRRSAIGSVHGDRRGDGGHHGGCFRCPRCCGAGINRNWQPGRSPRPGRWGRSSLRASCWCFWGTSSGCPSGTCLWGHSFRASPWWCFIRFISSLFRGSSLGGRR